MSPPVQRVRKIAGERNSECTFMVRRPETAVVVVVVVVVVV